MEPERVYLTSDGEFYADVASLARILDDRERNAAWLARVPDATDAPVERTPDGTLVVDAGGFSRIPFTTIATVSRRDVLPISLRAPGAARRAPCAGCGEAFGRAEAPLIPARDDSGD